LVPYTVRQIAPGDTVRRLHPQDGSARSARPTGPTVRVTKVDYRNEPPVAWLEDGTWACCSDLFLEVAQ
jgi:hypothetical protein